MFHNLWAASSSLPIRSQESLMINVFQRNVSVFLFLFYGIFHRGNLASETSTFGCVCPGMPNQTQTCLDLLRGFLCSLGV